MSVLKGARFGDLHQGDGYDSLTGVCSRENRRREHRGGEDTALQRGFALKESRSTRQQWRMTKSSQRQPGKEKYRMAVLVLVQASKVKVTGRAPGLEGSYIERGLRMSCLTCRHPPPTTPGWGSQL